MISFRAIAVMGALLFPMMSLAHAHEHHFEAPGFGAGQLEPPKVELSADQVDRLLTVLPLVADLNAKYVQKDSGAKMPSNNPMNSSIAENPQALAELEKLLKQHGFTVPEFGMQMSALISTYVALSPDAMNDILPSEETPEVKKVLDDPSVPAEQKEALRQQIRSVHENKHLLRAQLSEMATPHNKKVVKPKLKRVADVLEKAREVANTNK